MMRAGARNLFRSGARVCDPQQRPLFKTPSRYLADPARHPKLWDVSNLFRCPADRELSQLAAPRQSKTQALLQRATEAYTNAPPPRSAEHRLGQFLFCAPSLPRSAEFIPLPRPPQKTPRITSYTLQLLNC